MPEKKVRGYFRREMTGKSAAAHVLDVALVCAISAFFLYSWFYSKLRRPVLCWALALCAAAMIATAYVMVQSIRLDKFIKKHTDRIRKNAILEKLMLLDDASLDALLPSGDTPSIILRNHPGEEITGTQLLTVMRAQIAANVKSVRVYSVANLNANAESLLKRIPLTVEFHGKKDVLKLLEEANFFQEPALVESAVKADVEVKLGRRKAYRRAVMLLQPRAYLYCAAITAALSLVVGFNVYYLISAGACALLAGISAFIARKSRG